MADDLHLPPWTAKFCAQFPPDSRVCRIINRDTGYFLGVEFDKEHVISETSFFEYVTLWPNVNVDSKISRMLPVARAYNM